MRRGGLQEAELRGCKQNETVFFGQTAEIDLEGGNMTFGGRINASINTSD